MSVSSSLFWVLVASEFSIFKFGFGVFLVWCLLFFFNAFVCAGYLYFSGHAEIFFENNEVLLRFCCLAVMQLAIFFLLLSLFFTLFSFFNLYPMLFFLNLQMNY